MSSRKSRRSTTITRRRSGWPSSATISVLPTKDSTSTTSGTADSIPLISAQSTCATSMTRQTGITMMYIRIIGIITIPTSMCSTWDASASLATKMWNPTNTHLPITLRAWPSSIGIQAGHTVASIQAGDGATSWQASTTLRRTMWPTIRITTNHGYIWKKRRVDRIMPTTPFLRMKTMVEPIRQSTSTSIAR